MGLEEFASVISVGALKVMVVCGQFMPPEGLGDITAALGATSASAAAVPGFSAAMRQSISRFGYEPGLWRKIVVSPPADQRLAELARGLTPAPEGFSESFRKQVELIQRLVSDYFELEKARVERGILENVAKAFAIPGGAAPPLDPAQSALQTLCSDMGLEYAAILTGSKESDAILSLRATSGTLPAAGRAGEYPHFNWRKAGLALDQSFGASIDPEKVTVQDSATLQRGLRGGRTPFPSPKVLVPVSPPTGPLGLLLLGPRKDGLDLAEHEPFVLSACRDVCLRILRMRLAEILTTDRTDWERTSRMTGHRVRAGIQSVLSQLNTIVSFERGSGGVTQTDRDAAERDLKVAFRDLTEVSYAAESMVPAAFDVRVVARERVSLAEVVEAAVAQQADVAAEQGVTIRVSETLPGLPPVHGNATLLRYVFVNLVNNALKYSFPSGAHTRVREVRIKEPSSRAIDEAAIEVVNFGLGIKQEDLDRVFEWGVRLAPATPTFREIFGKGLGLWETRHIVRGHGGRISVTSTHFSGAPVTDDNIRKCITVFTVRLPLLEG